jgi:Spy/CpxP family protein refolding chaperone
MKNIFLSLFTIITLAFSAKAQDDNTPKTEDANDQKKEYRYEHHGFDQQKMADKLHFTDEQKTQFESINSDFKTRIEALEKENLTEHELKEKKQALVKERMEKVQALLTPEQKTQMQQCRKEGKGRREMNQGNRMEKIKSSLNLSDEQVEKMKAQREEFKSKEESIKNDQSLTADQKNEQLKSLRESKMNTFKSILTPDQLKKLEEMKDKRHSRTS